MATDSTAIANLALSRMGQDLIDDIAGSDVLEEKCNLLYTQSLQELLTEGPELGWKFTRRRYHGIDRDSAAVSAFADYSGTESGTVSVTTSSAHGLVTGDMATIDDTTNYDADYDVTIIDTTSFYVTATWVTDDATGTVYWTSEQYYYRYALPSNCFRIVSVQVGGSELTDWIREDDYLLTNEESDEIDVVYVYNETTTTRFPPWFTELLTLKLAIKLHYNLTQDLRAIQLLEQSYWHTWGKAVSMDEREKYVQEESSSWVDAGHTSETIE